MKMFFKLYEFIITKPKTITLEIADKLYWYHIIPMIPVRKALGVSMTASLFSGYRPKWWEIFKKRSGNSQHVFIGKGAVDWTCFDFENNKDELLRLIIEHTEYTRIAIYNSFIHCDYKETSGVRQLFEYGWDESEKMNKWLFIKNVA